MASQLTHFPHLKYVKAANDPTAYQDPAFNSVFEVNFVLPPQLAAEFKEDAFTLTEQVTQVSGLDALNKVPQAGEQKFLGASASYSNPTLDNTYADITIEFNLNLRAVTDNWVYRIFKRWSKLAYDLSTGTRTLANDYMSDGITVNVANRDGTVWRSIVFYRFFITSITGLDTLNYTDNEAAKLTVTFRTDLWDDIVAKDADIL